MAVATASISGPLTPPQYTISSRTIDYYYTLSFSAAADTYATGGITFDLTKAAANWSNVPAGLAGVLTVWVYSDTALNSYQFVRGTNLTNGKLVIYESGVQKTNLQALNAGGNEAADLVKVIVTCKRII
jgi:hypothetical protein